MFLFNLLADFAHPFRNANLEVEDSDDETDDIMSIASEAGSSDLLEVNDDDASMPDPALVVDAEALSNLNLDCVSTSPMSPLLKRPVSDDCFTPFSKSHCAIRPTRPTARYSAYKIPSRKQRQAFNRNCRRKEMFADDPHDSLITAAEPSTVPLTAYLALPSVHSDEVITLGEMRPTPHDSYSATQNSDLSIRIPGVVDRLALRLGSCSVSKQTKEEEVVVDRATQKSGLTIKIPGLVDRLALRFLSSLNVEEQTEEDEDVDSLSLDGYTASESSSDGGDIDDDDIPPFHSSLPAPTASAGGPDRSSRRKHRYRTAAPYHRAGGIRKRKELWVDTVRRESEVPAFLLESPSSSAF